VTFSCEETAAVTSPRIGLCAAGVRTTGFVAFGTGVSGIVGVGMGESSELGVCACGDCSGEEVGVDSQFRRICRAVNSRLESSVELTAVKPTWGRSWVGAAAGGGGGGGTCERSTSTGVCMVIGSVSL